MDQCQIIYTHLKQKEPCAFSKFNDGEHALLSPQSVASRGYQKTSDLLRQKLFQTLIWTHPRYYLGLPCPSCDPEPHKMDRFLRGPEKVEWLANVLINTNVAQTVQVLREELPLYPEIHLVAAEEANIEALEKEMNITVTRVYRVPSKNCFEDSYHQLVEQWKLIPDGSICLFCCGPLGRVLVYEWFSHKDSLTCLELGSLFDPITMKKAYMYHYGGWTSCAICNPKPSNAFLSYFSEGCEVEHYCENSVEELVHIRYQEYPQCILNFFKYMGLDFEYEYGSCLLHGSNQQELLRLHKIYTTKLEPGYKLYQNTHNYDLLKELVQRPFAVNTFTDAPMYDWKIAFDMALEASNYGDHTLGSICCHRVLQSGAPSAIKERVQQMLRVYQQHSPTNNIT